MDGNGARRFVTSLQHLPDGVAAARDRRGCTVARSVAGRSMTHVPMRTECKNFESRTYPSGDTVRKCNLDLAPDAPWRCPEPCASFERRLADVAWTHGTLITPPTPPEPAGLDDGSAAAILDEAEDVLNQAGNDIRAQVEAERAASARPGVFKRLFGRKR